MDVSADALGTAHRYHCPNCLWSRHLDDSPGDRAADCRSLMEPIAIAVRGDGEWVIVHQCGGCDELHLDRTAGDDNPIVLLRLAVRPFEHPPFSWSGSGSCDGPQWPCPYPFPLPFPGGPVEGVGVGLGLGENGGGDGV